MHFHPYNLCHKLGTFTIFNTCLAASYPTALANQRIHLAASYPTTSLANQNICLAASYPTALANQSVDYKAVALECKF